MTVRPLRVLYIVFDGTLGGSLASCADFIRHTDKAAVAVTFCMLGGPGATSDAIAAMGVEVVSFGATSWHDLNAGVAFWRFLRQRSFDVVHNNARTLFGHLALLLATRGTPRIYQEHGDLHTEGDEFACRVFYRLFHRMYGSFLTVGDETVEAMVEAGVPRHLINNTASPVDLSYFRPELGRREAKRLLGLDPEAVVVGTACRLVHQKDLGLFMAAAGLIAQARPDVRFVIAGEGIEEQQLKTQASTLGLDQRLVFVGNRIDMPVVWRCFDLFLLTSRQESFGRTILESLASATPIVGVRPGMGGGRILDGADGVRIIKGREPRELCAAAVQLLDDRRLREELGAAGRRWALNQDEFQVEKWAKRMQQAYTSVSPVNEVCVS